jgi:hypothetical protein
MKLGKILKYSGITAGAITALTLVSLHPIHIAILGVSAVVYFAGKSLDKK